jgi:hypothetical protein
VNLWRPFMTTAGLRTLALLQVPDDWAADFEVEHSMPSDNVYRIIHRPSGLMLWVANEGYGLNLQFGEWHSRSKIECFNVADKWVLWPHAQRIAMRPHAAVSSVVLERLRGAVDVEGVS